MNGEILDIKNEFKKNVIEGIIFEILITFVLRISQNKKGDTIIFASCRTWYHCDGGR